MPSSERIRAGLEGAQDLSSIVRAMKALSVVRIRQARDAVASLDGYRDAVELALQVALRKRPRGVRIPAGSDGGALAAVVFGSDLGLVGRFNARIAEFAARRLGEEEEEGEPAALLAVGARVAGELEALGVASGMLRFGAPGTIEAVTGLVQELLVRINALRREKGVERVILIYNHYHSGATYRPHRMHLLPLNPEWLAGLEARPWPGPSLPAFRVEWSRLFSRVVQEELFISLFGAAAESHAAEHAGRLAAMETAEDRIEERIRELTGQYHRARQQRITEELLDLVGGYTALTGEAGPGAGAPGRPGEGAFGGLRDTREGTPRAPSVGVRATGIRSRETLMDPAEIERFESLLLQERERALSDLQEAEDEEEEGQRESAGELSRTPHHMADAASDTQEAEKDFAVVNRETTRLERIDEALELLRTDPETYRACRECGDEISLERLELVPWTRHCASCAEAAEAPTG